MGAVEPLGRVGFGNGKTGAFNTTLYAERAQEASCQAGLACSQPAMQVYPRNPAFLGKLGKLPN